MFLCIVLNACAYSQAYVYTASGNRVLFQSENKRIVSVIQFKDSLHLNSLFNDIASNDTVAQKITHSMFLTSLSENLISSLSLKNGCQSTIANVYSLQNEDLYWETNQIFVKPKPNYTVESVLQNAKVQYRSVRQFGSDSNAYIVELLDNNAISASNILYENGEVVFAQPDWGMLLTPTSCTSDGQWNLHNMEYGYDINVMDAWQRSIGENIKVAVVDVGVELTHPYLSDNLLPGFDGTDGALGGADGSNSPDDKHGTQCAGIIAANGPSDNDIKGIAYHAKIIPVRMGYYRLGGTGGLLSLTSWTVSALRYAWNNADVISNSWGRSRDSAEMRKIEIQNAITNGRFGKGCVVTFSSGNDNLGNVAFMASMYGVVSVGAISKCGERKSPNSCDGEQWGSNYGEGLKIVAPGVQIPTTGLNGTIVSDFNGTSSACPHIAAVAALMLSVNPNLTYKDVDSILCSTAARIGNYQYETTDGHPYGEWNMEMGYGLVNAGAAVQAAFDLLYRPDLHIRDNANDDGSQPNIDASNYTSSPDIWITTLNGSAVTRVEEGGHYLVHVRVHNSDTNATFGNISVKLNCSQVSSNLNWGRAWNGGVMHPCQQVQGGLVDEQVINTPIVSGGDATVTFQWTVPTVPAGAHCAVQRYLNGLSYALLARVEDGHETVGEQSDDYDIRDFVLRNNNVAMKTLNVLQENRGRSVVAVVFRRSFADRFARIAYSSAPNGSGTHISSVANVYLQFDPSMLAAWPAESRQMKGCRQVNDSVFLITDTVATFDGFLPYTACTYFISSYVRYRVPQADSTEHHFSLRFDIVDGDSIVTDGSIDYIVMYDETAYFNVTAYEDMTVMAGESFELSAEADAADATFEWYNMQDALIGTGDHISLSTTTTQKYYVRGYSTSDNTVGYDTVTVTVKHGIITKITPNPAKNQVLVKYTLSDDVTNPTISLRNSYGMVVYSASVGTHPAQCHVNLRTLPTGNYTVSLEAGGMVLDSKTLVVQ